jgi:hypothetical protein
VDREQWTVGRRRQNRAYNLLPSIILIRLGIV